MRYRDIRPTLLRSIDTFEEIENVDYQPTPRWLSPSASGYLIAKGRGVLDLIPHPKPRFERVTPRTRRRGVRIPRDLQPWKS